MSSKLFSKERSVYWPAEFEPLFNFLKMPVADALGEEANKPGGVFDLNAHLMVFAALVGVSESNVRDLCKDKKEVPLSVFVGNEIEHYLYLVPMLSNQGVSVEIMKDEQGEDRAIKIFEQYAAGGCEILEAKRVELYLNSPDIFIVNLLKSYGLAWKSLDKPAPLGASSVGIRLFE